MASTSIATLVSDEDLVRRCCMGEPDAFSELYGRYRRRVLSTASRIIRNPEDAQDATQEIFLKMYRSISKWDPQRSQLSTWLYRMAANHAIDCWRVRHRRVKSEIAGDAGRTVANQLQDVDPQHAPQQVLENKELAGSVRRCIDALPQLQRRLFVLRHFHGLSLAGIAAAEHRSLGTVKGLLFRATRSVRRRLASSGRQQQDAQASTARRHPHFSEMT